MTASCCSVENGSQHHPSLDITKNILCLISFAPSTWSWSQSNKKYFLSTFFCSTWKWFLFGPRVTTFCLHFLSVTLFQRWHPDLFPFHLVVLYWGHSDTSQTSLFQQSSAWACYPTSSCSWSRCSRSSCPWSRCSRWWWGLNLTTTWLWPATSHCSNRNQHKYKPMTDT